MELIRKIIREELTRVIQELHAVDNEQIIYNFEAGRRFGINNLAQDISSLGEYTMSDYFPSSEEKESWRFSIEDYFGNGRIVEILHKKPEFGSSVWKLNVAETSDAEMPSIINSTQYIEGYDNFIEIVNSTINKDINPDFF